MSHYTGVIKFFNNEKGFGFVQPTDGAADVFLHISAWTPEGTYPKEGQRVSYDTVIDKKKLKPTAVNCRAST